MWIEDADYSNFESTYYYLCICTCSYLYPDGEDRNPNLQNMIDLSKDSSPPLERIYSNSREDYEHYITEQGKMHYTDLLPIDP